MVALDERGVLAPADCKSTIAAPATKEEKRNGTAKAEHIFDNMMNECKYQNSACCKVMSVFEKYEL
jgi:hypothetical protein